MKMDKLVAHLESLNDTLDKCTVEIKKLRDERDAYLAELQKANAVIIDLQRAPPKLIESHLRQVRAGAVMDAADKMGDAFVLPASLRRETQKAEFYKDGWRDAFLFLKQYASILAGKDGE